MEAWRFTPVGVEPYSTRAPASCASATPPGAQSWLLRRAPSPNPDVHPRIKTAPNRAFRCGDLRCCTLWIEIDLVPRRLDHYTRGQAMDRTRISRDDLQEMFDGVVQQTHECRHAYVGKVALVPPDVTGCNWAISSTSDAGKPACDEKLSAVTAVWKRKYVLRVTSQFAHNGVDAYLEAILLPEGGAWRYVGTWALLTAISGSRIGCTAESCDDPQQAIGSAGTMVRDIIDAYTADTEQATDDVGEK